MKRSLLLVLACACYSPPCSADDPSENCNATAFRHRCYGIAITVLDVRETGLVTGYRGTRQLTPEQVKPLIKVAAESEVGETPAPGGGGDRGYCDQEVTRPSGTVEPLLSSPALDREVAALEKLLE